MKDNMLTENRSIHSRASKEHERDWFSLILWALFTLIPKNLMSFCTGWLARLSLPMPIFRPIGRLFVTLFGINMAEAEKPLAEYRTIEDIFTRALKPGERKVMADFCSPVDGTLCQSGKAMAGHKAIQAKGLSYSLGSLVFGQEVERNLSWFTTIYLAPHNYHRVHTPVSGLLKEVRYYGGELWPVNPPFVKVVPDLFVRNERLVFEIELAKGSCHVVMVGALNVGRIESPFWPEMTTNDGNRVFEHKNQVLTFDSPQSVKAGDELGTFMLGSTVVVVFDEVAEEQLNLRTLKNGPVVMGQALLD